MSDAGDKSKKPAPRVEVIRKGVTPTPRPVSSSVVPRVGSPIAPRAVSPSSSAVPGAAVAPSGARPVGRGPPSRGGPPRGPRGPSIPRPPPTPEAIIALAKKERVPNRIARGELEGKMKCRIWKKLHPDEARRFDQAFNVMEANPTLELTDAFGVVQSGLSVDEFVARRARAKKRDEVKKARASVDGAAIDGFVTKLIADKTEVSVVLGERTVLDVLTSVQPVSFESERSGRLEKLQVVSLSPRTTWEGLQGSIERDAKLAQKPQQVARQPSRRPVNDPRPLLEHVGKPVRFVLRNGITVTLPLHAVGPFDVLLGDEGTVFVPLHAMISWSPA